MSRGSAARHNARFAGLSTLCADGAPLADHISREKNREAEKRPVLSLPDRPEDGYDPMLQNA